MQIKLHTSLASLAALLVPMSAAVKTSFDANFDDLLGSVSAHLDPVGIYYNISYSNFGVSQPGIANESVNGVIPHSDPNHAVGTASGASSLSIAYPGSTVKTFGLNSFYYGCTSGLLQAEVEAAVACNITVMGYKTGSTEPAAKQTFEFTPDEPVDLMNPPTFGMFSSAFQGLEHANFTFTPSTLVVLTIDDLVGSTQT